MPGRTVLSTVLLLWLAQPTLQGGAGYQPQNGGFGQMLMPFKGYGIGTQNANAYQPNTKAQGYGPAAPQPNGNGAKGYGAAQTAGNSGKPNGPYKGYGALPAGAPLRNGNGAKPNGPFKGYGAVPAALGNGNGAKPNGPYKGYGAAPASLVNGAKANGYGNGGKHNGYRPAPVATKGQGHKPYGYGASPLTSNGQQAKPISNGGYGYRAQPLYGGFGAGMRMAPPMATKGRGGHGKGNGFGQADSSHNGYRNKPAAYPQAGAGFGNLVGGGYTKGVKAAKPGYGGKPFVPSGQAAKPNAFVPGAGGPNAQGAKPAGYGSATGAKAGYSGFPNKGGIKGPKPGYGGLPTGYGQRPNGYGGYPNGGAKAPKPGYGGVGNGEANNGQGDKSNGYGGYPNGGAKAPKPGYGDGVGVGNGEANNGHGAKSNGYGVPGGVPKIQPGYGPVINGNEKELNGKSLNQESRSLPPVTGFIKGVIKPVEPELTVGVPALPLTKGMPSLVTSWKTPKPQDPVVSQSSPSKPIVPEQTPVIPQDNTPNPVPSVPQGQTPAPLLPQANGTNPPAQPSPKIPQGSPQKPDAPILFSQENDIKPTTEVQQSVSPASPQGNVPKPEVLRPTTPQGNSPKPTAAPVLPSVLPQTKDTKPVAPVPEIPQMKDPKPVAPEPDVPQTTVPSLAIEPTPAMPQMKGQKLPNPDCGHGVSGQWTKLPSAGYGSGPWYPNNEGAKASKPGQGYDPKPQQPDYVNPGAGFGFAGLGGMTKGQSGASPVEPQTAELGPEVKSGHAYGGPYGAQPMGMGSEGMPQVRYGIGGLLFGGWPAGYGSNPYGKYGNAYAAQPFGSKAAGNYNPSGFNADPKSAPKYRMEGSPYAASDAKVSGKYGPYGGQQFGLPVNYGKYGNPSLPFEALGPVTDGQSVDQPALQYEVPVIDGVKSVDQFGDGEVPHQPIAPLVDGVGEGPVSHIKGGVGAEAVPTGSPFTGSAASLGNSAHPPVDTPSEAVTPQHLLIQQNLKGPQLPQANSWTGGEEPKHNLKGFFGNGYHG